MSTEINVSSDSTTNIKNMLEVSKRERDGIKAQMYDATKRLTELEGIIAALQRTVELMEVTHEPV